MNQSGSCWSRMSRNGSLPLTPPQLWTVCCVQLHWGGPRTLAFLKLAVLHRCHPCIASRISGEHLCPLFYVLLDQISNCYQDRGSHCIPWSQGLLVDASTEGKECGWQTELQELYHLLQTKACAILEVHIILESALCDLSQHPSASCNIGQMIHIRSPFPMSIRGSAVGPHSAGVEGVLPPEHHTQTATSKTKRPCPHWRDVRSGVPNPMCWLLTYVGWTDRCPGKRVKEHCRAVGSGDCESSALAEHHPKTGTWSECWSSNPASIIG